MTIVSIRGTHGSGKSTIVQRIMAAFPTQPIPGPKRRPSGYVVDLPNNRHLYIPGPYDTACGGCDAIQPYSDIIPLLDAALKRRHDVLFEGALVSSSYGSIGAFMEYQNNPIFAFLDTPLNICLARIAARRAARWEAMNKPGQPPPVNPTNTAHKLDSVMGTKKQLVNLGSCIRVVDLDYTKAEKQVLALFGVTGVKLPPVGRPLKLTPGLAS